MLDSWLETTFAETSQDSGQRPRSGKGEHLQHGRYVLHGPGILELIPANPGPHARVCVVSAGLHGNETAPIELVGELLARLEAGLLRLGAPMLVLLGNIPALRRQQRFIGTNLNRLFRRDNEEAGAEPERARELMAAVDRFYARHAACCSPDTPPIHYDLHTAIRDSRYPRFVVEPCADRVTDNQQWRWLAAAGIQAALHQHQHSWTFSHYSRHYHGAQAFTLELGRVAPFGANDLEALHLMRMLLEALLEGRAPPEAPASRMAFFRVEHELVRQSQSFRLCFAEETPNFTEFAPGTRLASDAEAGDYLVGERPLSVVFPNANVEIGARAALLVAPEAAPAAPVRQEQSGK
ncbi:MULTISPECIES: succinylglutamate desuccinylase [Halomonadaceae]|uniref:succinylglutamate desuccinylase n=1 Tax=Halomonadaceae TaxID=28256 RepID=UPI00159752E3|nr:MULTISPECIES: succinylglutamate desuccinylase [Halomonas]QJQ95947.1 succinylglutamate desuccinylase [Halomonas sp. PA5]